jgi:hypothetical protein
MSNLPYGNPDDVFGMVNAMRPRDYFEFLDDFMTTGVQDTAELENWFVTTNAGGAYAGGDVTDGSPEQAGGLIVLTPGATASDVVNLTTHAQMFMLNAGLPLYFEARFYIVDLSDTGIGVGLSNDTDLRTAASSPSIVFDVSNAGVMSFITTNAGGTASKTLTPNATPADGSWVRVAFYYDGNDTLTAYAAVTLAAGTSSTLQPLGTKKISTTADYVPSELGMGVCIEVENIVGSTSDAVWFDYVHCVQKRQLWPI